MEVAHDLLGRLFSLYTPSLLPLLFVCIIPSGLALCYILSAFVYRHTTAIFPRISHTGDQPPESMYFSFNLGIAAILLSVISVHVYRKNKRLVVYWREHTPEPGPLSDIADTGGTFVGEGGTVEHRARIFQLCNRLALLCALLTAIGTLAVGAFQIRHTFFLHVLALGIMGVPGYVFFALQTYLSRTLLRGVLPPVRVRRLYLTRVIVMGVSIGCIALFFALTLTARVTWTNATGGSVMELVWSEVEPGFVYFATSNSFQWAWMAANFALIYTLRTELTVPILVVHGEPNATNNGHVTVAENGV